LKIVIDTKTKIKTIKLYLLLYIMCVNEDDKNLLKKPEKQCLGYYPTFGISTPKGVLQ